VGSGWERPSPREPSAGWDRPAPPPPASDATGGWDRAPPPPPRRPEPPTPAAARSAPPSEPRPAAAADSEFLTRLAKGAGIPEQVFLGQKPGDVAEEIGLLFRIVAENLKQLLSARSESRGLLRSSRQTMVQAFDNNPLKFSPTPEDALRIIFGPQTKSYLDARQTVKQSFEDVKTHQLKTYAAMQQAVQMLVEDLDPSEVEKGVEADRGLGKVVGSRKARLWDAYVARWEAKAARHDNGLVDAFMIYFSECYQRNANKIR
jgi:type VI secretion system protein ImpI